MSDVKHTCSCKSTEISTVYHSVHTWASHWPQKPHTRLLLFTHPDTAPSLCLLHLEKFRKLTVEVGWRLAADMPINKGSRQAKILLGRLAAISSADYIYLCFCCFSAIQYGTDNGSDLISRCSLVRVVVAWVPTARTAPVYCWQWMYAKFGSWIGA